MRLATLAVLLALLVVVLPGALPAEAAPLVAVLFALQVLVALAIVGAALVRSLRADAERRALRDLGVALRAAHQERSEAVAAREELARTVSELRALNEQLRAELRSRDDAVASAVHELRTPLTSVQAYGQLMSRNLQAVQRQVTQLERLIGDLLQMQGPRALAAEEVDLAREGRDAVHRLELVTDADVELAIADDGPHVVRGDALRLGQVLDNLLRNAAKFSPPSERIDVTVRRDGAEVLVAVTDRGAGIPSQELTAIFERYYRGTGQRREVAGEGIGLAICSEIVAAHGGRIWAMSPGPRKGSTFFIALPAFVALPATEPAVTASGSAGTPDPAGETPPADATATR